VTVAEHDVAPRYHVPARTVDVYALTAREARLRVLRWAHGDAGVPPWKPCVRVSWPNVSAKAA